MKKLILLIIVLSSTITFTHATHNVGGEISLNQLDYKQYEVNLMTYTKSSSVPADRDSLQLCWGDGICEFIPRDTFFSLGCDLQKNIYKKIHTYADEGSYIVSMTDPNRNSGILNVNPPSSDNVLFHLQTMHTVSSDWNNTPTLLNFINDKGSVGKVFQHNPAAVDTEGDSLSYSFIVPMQGVNMDVPNYSFPNEINSGSNNDFTIHEEFGTVTWDSPQLVGRYTFAILIKEFRNGNLLSETIRDMEIEITDLINSPPAINLQIEEITLDIGDTFMSDVTANDDDMNDVKIKPFGLPFIIDNPATFSLDETFIPVPVLGNFSWTVTYDHSLLEPFYVVFRVVDDINLDCGFTNYKVMKININRLPTSIENVEEKLELKIYPNPVVSNELVFQLPEMEIIGEPIYEIKSISGRVILEDRVITNHPQTISIQNLRNGFYFLSIQVGNQLLTRSFVVKR